MGINNEKGYVLVLTLVIIVIIGVLIPPLIGSALSSASQAQRSEENSQLIKMNEMGIMSARNSVLEKVEDINQLSETDVNSVINYLERELNFQPIDLSFQNYKGKVNGSFIPEQTNDNEIIITYQIESNLLNSRSSYKETEEIFTIRSNSGGTSSGNHFDWSQIEEDPPFQQLNSRDVKTTGNNREITVNGNATFRDQLQINNGLVEVTDHLALISGGRINPHSRLIVSGNLLVKDRNLIINNMAEVIVQNDFYLENAEVIFQNSSNQKEYLCVQGDVKKPLNSSTQFEKIDSCQNINSKKGFFVVGEVIEYNGTGEGEEGTGPVWYPIGTSSTN
ncbi:hypothetical protein CR194_10800 [Salipaludibacillus keqinensis]|uniref:Uncharacterized protein n=1 Tax=Salipaludibacillus keqinensis TaxID=2045207 RepID=A0A323TFK8_9BACI|nr:hypothetical protein [Salipaludibacillus keqinensis]PYZ93639.1 hypothetical protein CR194_10800 [Salipaludibacillus keqinensis]